ncbi:alpha-amylase family glycosyl hydrolase [Spirosoma sp. SC4-14]|uniref:alpha-amylase family glycosyl hydrolase n=1 Tax=Spirosoma sp. SC4-14 TaxID=3128900 RepID=UPI0030D12BA1
MMSQIQIDRRTLGVTFTADRKANVRVWAPLAKQAAISTNNHSGSIPLSPEEPGYWSAETDQIKPGDLYTFVLDDEKESADPASLIQPQGLYGPSQAFDTNAFYWEDSCWINPPLDEFIVYELDIYNFTPEGTFKAIVRKLAYLKELGVNAIVIKPVTPFPEVRSQTDSAFMYAVQASYGGPGQLQHLINACHYEGIAVIMDMAYHQGSPQQNSPRNLGVSKTRRQPADRAATRTNRLQQEAYRRYLLENVLMWFRDFHIDALRLEIAHTIPGSENLLQEIRSYTNALTAITGRQYYLLVEQDMQPAAIQSQDQNDYEINGTRQMTAGGGYHSCYEEYGTLIHQTRVYREDCLYDKNFSGILQELFDRKAENAFGKPFVMISQKYDQLLDEPSDERIDMELLKLIAGSVMVSPYVPTLFMGEEWGATNPFLGLSQVEPGYSTDERFCLMDREPMLMSALLEDHTSHTLYRYYQALTALRREQPALNHLNQKQMEVFHQSGHPTMVLHRWYNENHVLCLMNFSDKTEPIAIPRVGRAWTKLLDSADPAWYGPRASALSISDTNLLLLQPESIVVYKAVDSH